MDRYQIRFANQMIRKILVVIAALFILPSLVHAQDTVGDGSTVVYPADYFTQWQPITAQDMLQRIPGQDSRGPGGGGGSRGGGGFGGFGGNPTRGGRGLGAGSTGTEV